jgi:hypothetical protein
VVGGNEEAVQLDLFALEQLAGVLMGAAAFLGELAGGTERALPPMPRDDHGLLRRFVALDEARERFDRSVAEQAGALGGGLGDVARGARQADTAPAFAGGGLT